MNFLKKNIFLKNLKILVKKIIFQISIPKKLRTGFKLEGPGVVLDGQIKHPEGIIARTTVEKSADVFFIQLHQKAKIHYSLLKLLYPLIAYTSIVQSVDIIRLNGKSFAVILDAFVKFTQASVAKGAVVQSLD